MSKSKINSKIILAAVIAVLAVIVLASSITVVGTGKVGVTVTLGAVKDGVVSEGLHFKIPFIQSIKQIDIKTLKSEADCQAASKDLQTITTKVAVNHHVDGTKAAKLWQTVGKDYQDILVTPAIQEAVKRATSRYSAEECITKREEVGGGIQEELSDRLSSYGIIIDSINIINFDFSEEFNRAIEAKQTAQQNVLKAEQELKEVEVEALKTRTKADAEAYAIKVLQDQIAQNPNYIEYLKAQKWDGKLPQVQGGSTSSIIDFRTSDSAAN
ncbi:MAG: prohibitin family protein [Oscillospiraceae bacterium]|jgi:regulator of protease activity HflC (stomatin/prohibitin superfamily)|nr:prohibitin family protein [Oscillospiraceae bacterium]